MSTIELPAETEVAIDGLVAVGAGLRRNHADADLIIPSKVVTE